MRQALLTLTMLWLASAPVASIAQPGPDRDSLVVWGTIERLYSSHRLLVRTDDDRLYTIRASGTPVELSGGDLGRWDDLRVGLHIDVFGTVSEDRTVDASYIRLTGGSPRDRSYRDEAPDRYRRYDSRNHSYDARRYPLRENSVEILGTVASVDLDRESIRLETRHGLRRVELFDDTLLRTDSGRRLALADVRPGDELTVFGQDRGERFVADRVTLVGPSPRSYGEDSRDSLPPRSNTHVITGTVRASTYHLSRRITVRTPDGEVKVDVDRDTPIEELGDRISVHELEPGDHVRVFGDWTGSDRFAAQRIEVTPTRAVRTLTRGYRATTTETLPVVTVLGQLVSFDENRDRMRLSTRQGDRILVANGVPAYVRGTKISRRNFQVGDRVRASGYWNGREVLATRVELAY